VAALRQDARTSFRVRPDGVVLLDSRFFRVPEKPVLESAPSAEWQDAYRGGLFGLDGAHPTTIGYGIIAHEMLKVMQAAGVPKADPEALPWRAIVDADELVNEPPAILSSLQRTLEVLFGTLALDRVIAKLAGYGAEKS
jgi:hypothetical protein